MKDEEGHEGSFSNEIRRPPTYSEIQKDIQRCERITRSKYMLKPLENTFVYTSILEVIVDLNSIAHTSHGLETFDLDNCHLFLCATSCKDYKH